MLSFSVVSQTDLTWIEIILSPNISESVTWSVFVLPQENLSVSALLTCVPAQPLSFFRLLFLECSVDVVLHVTYDCILSRWLQHQPSFCVRTTDRNLRAII